MVSKRGRTLVIGDIHGAYRALVQCFDRSGFNRKADKLIILGDICDGYPEVKECIDELLACPHRDLILGNHDKWAMDWALTGEAPEIWRSQGGDRTIASYSGGPMPKSHVDFLKSGKLWIEMKEQLFIHAGFDPDKPLASQGAEKLIWDRSLIYAAWAMHLSEKGCKIGPYKNIFIGHTPTLQYGVLEPTRICNIWALDTGAGWTGKLTIMDVDTKEYWQSDLTPVLYEGIAGRQ